ncbi:hypothetical protein CEXT_559111 [Caerostris extrusa]|uniref:Uncharacterized protein n=1 Tax=Caerostris extrusa TaxID=172846 RepID=A0AAV4VE72_CAEEX|nr:hypothetical protein CEXT_559111 [Caerostris extrusa]
MQGDANNPRAAMADNFRPVHDLNQRSIRTNIDFSQKPQTILTNSEDRDRDTQIPSVATIKEKKPLLFLKCACVLPHHPHHSHRHNHRIISSSSIPFINIFATHVLLSDVCLPSCVLWC